MYRRAFAGVVVAASIVVATPAFAQTPGGDTIVLKSGGLYRGTLIDVVPNDHARIRLDTGEIANVPWSEIDHVDASARTPGAPPAATPPLALPTTPRDTGAPPAPSPPPVERVFVHMTGSPDATLQRGSGRTWAVVCSSPCDKWVPIDGGYRVEGQGIRYSTAFGLVGANGGRVDLDVDPASKSAFVGGIVATSVGYGVAPIGLIILALGFASNATCGFSDDSTPCNGSSAGSGLLVAGGITILVGVVTGTIGVATLASNVHSTVTQTSDVAGSVAPQGVSSPVPAWRETPSAATARALAPNVAPLYTIAF